MSNSERPPGKTTVSPDVLISIAKLSALGVPGVSRMAPISGGVNRLFRKGANEGVRIEVERRYCLCGYLSRAERGCQHPRGQPQRTATR